jgi:uncharacterized protein (UPF0335 family)
MNKNLLITKVFSLMEDIDKNSEGFDKKVLLQAMQLKEDDFSRPMTGEEMLKELGMM